MNEARKRVCSKCRNTMYCNQACYPISKDEYEYMGVNSNDDVTIEGMLKLMECSMKPECMERLLEKHPAEWWFERLWEYAQRRAYYGTGGSGNGIL